MGAPKVEVVRLGISRVPRRQGRQAVRREVQPDLPGDCPAQLALQFEHASGLALVGLRPYLYLVANVNQLRRHAQSAALGPNGPFHQILDPQLVADLRDRLRSALVAPGRYPALHSKMLGIDLAKRRTGFFGQAVRQVLALRTPEVFEGQDGDQDLQLHRWCGSYNFLVRTGGNHPSDQPIATFRDRLDEAGLFWIITEDSPQRRGGPR